MSWPTLILISEHTFSLGSVCGSRGTVCGSRGSVCGSRGTVCGSRGSVCGSRGSVCGSRGSVCGSRGTACGSRGSVCGSRGSVCGSQGSVCGYGVLVYRMWIPTYSPNYKVTDSKLCYHLLDEPRHNTSTCLNLMDVNFYIFIYIRALPPGRLP